FHAGQVLKVAPQKYTAKTITGFEVTVDARVVEATMDSSPGESGGPLVNDKGELVGVLTGSRTAISADAAEKVGLYIDLSELKGLLEEKKLLPKTAAPPATPAKPTATPKPAAPAAEEAEDVEKTAARKLKFAKELAAEGKLDKALERYRDVVKQYPRTKAAEE